MKKIIFTMVLISSIFASTFSAVTATENTNPKSVQRCPFEIDETLFK